MIIPETNLSRAWGRLLVEASKPKRKHAPILVSISGFENSIPQEDKSIRAALRSALCKQEKYTIENSSMIVFPYKQWKRRKDSQTYEEFFEWYLKEFLPRLKGRDKNNARGTYFERMIKFTGTRPNGKKESVPFARDQLGKIIESWKRDKAKGRRSRKSSMQASCFDPAKDHNGSVLSGFPCLQQVSFSYDDFGGLSVNAYYPTQYVFARAYGNYLGLAQLGHFMAHELELELVQLNCFIGDSQLEVGKGKIKELYLAVQTSLDNAEVELHADETE